MMTSMSADLAAYNRQRANEFKEVSSYFYLNLCLLHGIAEVCVDLSLTTSTAPCMRPTERNVTTDITLRDSRRLSEK